MVPHAFNDEDKTDEGSFKKESNDPPTLEADDGDDVLECFVTHFGESDDCIFFGIKFGSFSDSSHVSHGTTLIDLEIIFFIFSTSSADSITSRDRLQQHSLVFELKKK